MDDDVQSSSVGTDKSSLKQDSLSQKVNRRSKTRRASETIVYDDGTNTFFWQAHTVSVLIIVVIALTYYVFTEKEVDDQEYNSKRGITAAVLMFFAIGLTQVKDGPFVRPHPIIWRFILCSSMLYEFAILFLLFQSSKHVRMFLTYLDPELNKPLDFRAYGGNCTLWDPGHPDGPLHNIMDKMDCFVVAHFFGWFFKALLILRDVWITTVISFTFELLEYTFEHQLPNFSECWWDHWILDFLICNGLGIYLGMLCLKYLSAKEYKWQGLWNIPSYRGKVRRVVGQFSPYSWVQFHWKPTENLYRWLLVSYVILMFLIAEMNTFYLKFILWIPPNHPLVIARLIFFAFWGAVALREVYDFMGGVSTKFGDQAWIGQIIIITEFLVVLKFGWDVITIPFPFYVKWAWAMALLAFVVWTIWKFQMRFPRFKALVQGGGSKVNIEFDTGELNSDKPEQGTNWYSDEFSLRKRQ